ncbi:MULTISPECIES: hypothetical protein [unclassified Methylosinus]|jgi:hypothetical protein|nr:MULTISPECIES: hypothetical protein [unclassified Methylosinus]
MRRSIRRSEKRLPLPSGIDVRHTFRIWIVKVVALAHDDLPREAI